MTLTVLGSTNMDIVAITSDYPKQGNTIFGKEVKYLYGGKGANQAIAAAKLGKEVSFISAVGDDPFGNNLLNNLVEHNVDISFVKRSKEVSTGVALCINTINNPIENTMVVMKGANDNLSASDLLFCKELLKKSDVLLIQMETPEDIIIEAMKIVKENGGFVILDPAPAEGITTNALGLADIIIPNIQETKYITGVDVTDIESGLIAAKKLEQMGVNNCIIKMAEKGSLVFVDGEVTHIKPIPVHAIDTIGAGDAFAGAFACAIADGLNIMQAVEFANVVGAIKVTRVGAQQGTPTMKEVIQFCEERNIRQHYDNTFSF